MVNVKSEIKPLKKVLVHRPGRELLNLTPASLNRLLFDDIPYLSAAQREHDQFVCVLEQNGAEVVYLEKLAAQTLQISEQLKKTFVEQYIDEAGIYAQKYRALVFDFLMTIEDTEELVLKTMEGIRLKELDKSALRFLENCGTKGDKLVIDPMPNLYFTRDTMVVIGERLCINSMYSATRRRETLYGEYIFTHHPDFKGRVKRCYGRSEALHIEGGDITNLNERVIAIGVSERTCADAVEKLAYTLFTDEDCAVDTVLAFTIPSKRAFMHLDTVFTQIDYDKFAVHSGILDTLEVFELTLASDKKSLHIQKLEDSLERILERYTGAFAVSLVRFGSDDTLTAEREQWNDGSNTLCVAPGEIIVYERNEASNELLASHGVKLHTVPSCELSRGRGGPRCMSMPLVRAEAH